MGDKAYGETPATLEAEGWTRRFTAVGMRLSEVVELYRVLGYEVRLELADARKEEARGDACERCFVMTLARTVYTRWPGGTSGDGEQRG